MDVSDIFSDNSLVESGGDMSVDQSDELVINESFMDMSLNESAKCKVPKPRQSYAPTPEKMDVLHNDSIIATTRKKNVRVLISDSESEEDEFQKLETEKTEDQHKDINDSLHFSNSDLSLHTNESYNINMDFKNKIDEESLNTTECKEQQMMEETKIRYSQNFPCNQVFSSTMINFEDEVKLHNTSSPYAKKSDKENSDAIFLSPSNKSEKQIDITKSPRIKVLSPSNFMSPSRFERRLQQLDMDDVMTTPRTVKPLIPSRSPSPSNDSDDIIDISSDEEINPVPVRKPNLLQTTLFDHFDKNRSNTPNVQKQLENALAQSLKDETENNSNVKSPAVSQSELSIQKKKVQMLLSDVARAKNMLMTINLNGLPDKGKLLLERHEDLVKQAQEEEEVLQAMIISQEPERVDSPIVIIDNEDSPVKTTSSFGERENSIKRNLRSWHIDTPPGETKSNVKWEDLEAESANVQPRTFGKRAMATHNLQKALTMDKLEQLHGSLATRPEEHQVAEEPSGLKINLMPHQTHALAWLLWREKQKPSGGILADDMGLGKTLTMISLVLKSKELEEDDEDDSETENEYERKKYIGGTLVICPASLLSQWEGEVKKRVRRGLLAVEIHHGAKRELKPKRLAKHDMVITTYATAMKEFEKNSPLFGIKWRRIILDEAHQVRNYKSQTSIAVCHLTAVSRWALTGTPVHNKELDLYALLKFLRCSPFDDLLVWKRWVTNKNVGGQDRLNTVMSSLLLRRTKAQLMEKGTLNCLPERTWELIEIKLDNQEMMVYQKILIFSRTLFAQYLHQRAEKNSEESVKLLNDANSEYFKMHKKLVKLNKVKTVQSHEILVLLLRLRQICCHPSLIIKMLEGEELQADVDDGETEELNLLDQLNRLELESDTKEDFNASIAGISENPAGVGLAEATRGILNPSNPVFSEDRRSTKVKAVLTLLKEKVLSKGDKAIIVSQWTSMLKLIAMHLKSEGIVYQQLDGSVPVPKRMEMVDDFNNPSHKTKIFLLSLTAGGVGLNLIGGNHLLLLDLHWNPQLEMQAQDRIYRVGQTKHVYVYKFMALDTIEQRIKCLQEKKMELAESMLTGAKTQQTKLSLDDLKMLFNM